MNRAAGKNGLMGTNGRVSRNMETTAKEYQAMRSFRKSGEAIPEMKEERGQALEGF